MGMRYCSTTGHRTALRRRQEPCMLGVRHPQPRKEGTMKHRHLGYALALAVLPIAAPSAAEARCHSYMAGGQVFTTCDEVNNFNFLSKGVDPVGLPDPAEQRADALTLRQM